jgi:uncharacterized membrane protein YbhN (UPF0104 family)
MKLDQDSFNKFYQFLTQKKLGLFYFIVLTVLLILFFQKKIDHVLIQTLLKNRDTIAMALGISLIFILTKSLGWFYTWRSQNILLSYLNSGRLFLMASAIDLLVYPAKISADLFSIAYLKDYNLTQKTKAVLLFRICAILPFIVLTSYWLARHSFFYLLIGFALLGIVLKLPSRYLRQLKGILPYWKTMLILVTLTLITLLVEFARISILLRIFRFNITPDFLLWFVVSHSLGVASGIPAGLGVKDAALVFYLAGMLSPAEIAVFLILLRFTGEIFSAFLGWCLAGQQALQLLRGIKSASLYNDKP